MDNYQDIRDGVSALCTDFPGEYWQKLDAVKAYPDDFVNNLTDSGFLAALIPEEYGGSGFARELDIERKFRETRLYQVAPVSTNLILSFIGEHVLDMPRSY